MNNPYALAIDANDNLYVANTNSNTISKYGLSSDTTLLTASGCSSNNSTKATPCLSADILGDWREEVIWRTTDSSALRIYTTTTPATDRIYTLMHDPQYRLSIAWQRPSSRSSPMNRGRC